MIRIDMSEYTESHSITQLISAPSGKNNFSIFLSIISMIYFLDYVNFEEGGQLIEAIPGRIATVRKRPS